MIRTIRFAAVFAAAVAFAGASLAQVPKGPFTVKDLSIDHTSTVSFADATTQGREGVKLAGAQRLIERLTLPEDRNGANPPLQAIDVARFAGAITSQSADRRSSTSSGYRVVSIAAYTYNADAVRKYLTDRGVAFIDSQSGKALLIPAVAGGVNSADWGAQWSEARSAAASPAQAVGKSDDNVLTPYLASKQAWPRRPSFTEIQNELTASGANHAVVAEAFSQNGQIYVRILDLRTGAPDTSGNVAGPFPDLGAAQRGAVAEMERAWKAQSIVRTSGSTSIALVAAFRDLGEWVKIRRSLEASRLVSGIDIESISAAGADISFVFNGRPDQLAADLRSRGVSLSGTDSGWLLQVASSQ